ncbi:MAG: DUF2235 domain-containing protein [Paucimonas sp.]|jgi:hypothetical protein|nr:DUF2235 domain-containing protein [Paucimonas sp.]
MSEVNAAPVCYPPQFPVEGRLPRRAEQVYANLAIQREQEQDYQDALSLASGRRVPPPCCKTLHISLFFDGTGNNLNHDLYLKDTPSPTNIGRLFRATIGSGYAGGTSHSPLSSGLTDPPGTGRGQYFKYYIPGVGTSFPEVNDLDFTTAGLAFAAMGEERINWGLLMVIDALRSALGLPRQSDASLLSSTVAMGTTWLPVGEQLKGRWNRRRELERQMAALEKPLRQAMAPGQPGRSQLLGIRLYVYGFSRGAAGARAFINWLNRLLEDVDSAPVLVFKDIRLPVEVQYLGLLDTVASVGAADSFPGGDGHMAWADDTQELPRGKLVKRCLHIVASHEQRLSFPLDSIRREDGSYPENAVEVVHPGVHSDQGGGYPPGDQGKAIGNHDGLLLSQLAVHSLYSDAYTHGAPLKVPKLVMPPELAGLQYMVMPADLLNSFRVDSLMVGRFNAWRQVTLGLECLSEPLSLKQIEIYQPIPSDKTVEAVLRDQLGWITAWRIDRYAFATLEKQPFYLAATDTEADEDKRKAAEYLRNLKHEEVKKRRDEQRAREKREGLPPRPLEPGVKDFDADMGQTQLRDAAREFEKSYKSERLEPWPIDEVVRVVVQGLPEFEFMVATFFRMSERMERKHIYALGRERVGRLFPPARAHRSHTSPTHRGDVDESVNVMRPEGLLRALFDDQVHDSRAWFLYKFGREPLGGYFGERMVFFGATHRRALAGFKERHAELFADSAVPANFPSEETEAARLAEAMDQVDADWARFHAGQEGVSNASV